MSSPACDACSGFEATMQLFGGNIMYKVTLISVCVCFRDEHNDILAVADWGQKLSFYQLSGKQVSVCLKTVT